MKGTHISPVYRLGDSLVIAINENTIQAPKNKWISDGLEKYWLILLVNCTY